MDINSVFKRRHTHEPLSRNIPETGRRALFSGTGRVRIGFAGLAAGSGTTTLAFAAAEYLAAKYRKRKTVAFLELDPRPTAPAGRPYDKIGIDRRFAGRDFIPIYKLAGEGGPMHEVWNIDGGIHWALRRPGEPPPVPADQTLLRLLHNVEGDIIVCDIHAHTTMSPLLADLNRLICIFDPLPSRLLASVPAAELCRAAASAGVPVTYVFNKINPGVNLREATRFSGISDYVPFPAVPAEAVYSAEYACRSLASVPEINNALAELFG